MSRLNRTIAAEARRDAENMHVTDRNRIITIVEAWEAGLCGAVPDALEKYAVQARRGDPEWQEWHQWMEKRER